MGTRKQRPLARHSGRPLEWGFLGIDDRRTRPVLYLVSGELVFVTLMVCCCAIEPSSAAVKRGLSYYGNSLTTGIPYAIAFILFIGMTASGLARLDLHGPAAQRFRYAVVAVLALMAAVPLTPYAVDVLFDWIHIGFVSILFLSALGLGTWIAGRLRDRVTAALFLTESLAGLAILAAQIDLNDYMIPTELVFQLASFGLLLQGARRLAGDGRTGPSRTSR